MKNLKEYINEGLFDFIKLQKQFTSLKADVTAKVKNLNQNMN